MGCKADCSVPVPSDLLLCHSVIGSSLLKNDVLYLSHEQIFILIAVTGKIRG